jgi:ABC-type multidrug transport system fused ATPase/permease subunit
MEHAFNYIKQLYNFSGKILYMNLLGMVLVSLLEGIGILLLVPLLSISGIIDFNYNIPQLEEVSNILTTLPETVSLLLILTFFFSIIVGQNLLQRNVMIRNVKIQECFSRRLRLDIYCSLLHANWTFFLRKRKSDLVNLLTIELARVIGGINLFLQLFTNTIFTIIQIAIALWLSAKLSLFILLCGAVLGFFSRKFIKRSKQLGNQTSKHSQSYLAGITDQLNGIKDIKSNTLEGSHLTWLQSLTTKMNREQIEYVKLKTNSQLYYKVASGFLIACFIFLSLSLFQSQLEQLLLIILIFSRLWPRFTGIQSNLEQIAATIPAFKFISTLQKECQEAREFDYSLQNYNNIKPVQINSALECRNVDFRYNQNESKYSLKSINLIIPANQMTALVGQSGAGKSTLIDILMGLNRPESGEVLIDGLPLSEELLLSLRRSISYVPQDPFLFNSSIKENLLIIDPNASEEQIWEALEFSAAADFVSKLPQELDTIIGDRGIRLSGGERQRLVLARAILRKPSILVLDEATSALDAENEAKIQEAIDRLKGKMTIIVIAHRLSTIRNADQVVVLDQGKIIQMGEFNQLAKEKRSMFSNLLDKQLELAP